jgi:hypothetical protein
MRKLKYSGSGAGSSTSAQHGKFAALIGLCMAVAAFSVFGNVSTRYWSACAFSGVALFSALGHLLILALQRRERSKQLHAPPVQRSVRTSIVACLVGAFAVVPVCLWPVLLIESLGWPRTKASDVEFFSPGDKAKLWVNGPPPRSDVYRVRNANAVIKNAEELGGPATLPVSVENHPTVQPNSKESRGEAPSRYLIQVVIPDEPGWIGKTVRAQVHLVLEDADKQGTGWIVSGSAPVEIYVAPEGAAERYRESWWIAFLGGALPAVLLGFVLSRVADSPRPKQFTTGPR